MMQNEFKTFFEKHCTNEEWVDLLVLQNAFFFGFVNSIKNRILQVL